MQVNPVRSEKCAVTCSNPHHAGQRIVSVCTHEECGSSLCCVECMTNEHAGHKCVLLKKIAEDMQERLQQTLADDFPVPPIQAIENTRARIRDNINRTREYINHSIDKSIEILDELFRPIAMHARLTDMAMLDELERFWKIDSQPRLREAVESFISFEKYCKDLTKLGLNIQQKISQELQQLEWTYRDIRSRWLEPFAQLTPPEMRELHKSEGILYRRHQNIEEKGNLLSLRNVPPSLHPSSIKNQTEMHYIGILKYSLLDAESATFRFRLIEGRCLIGVCDVAVVNHAQHTQLELSKETLSLTNVSGVFGVYTSGPQSSDFDVYKRQRDCETGEEITVKFNAKQNKLVFSFGKARIGEQEVVPQEGSPLYLCVALTPRSSLEFLGYGDAPLVPARPSQSSYPTKQEPKGYY